STPTPIALPITQWLGNGFGHIGSTTNRGAMTGAAVTFATLSSTIDATPSASANATKIVPSRRCQFILLNPPRSEVSYSSRTPVIIHASKSGNQLFSILAMLCALPFALAAHDIPNDVTAQLFIKPEGQHLNVLVRVPLKSIRDVVFPQRGNGYLDLERTAPMLTELATLWISDFIELYEGTEALPKRPRVVAARATLESDRSFLANQNAGVHLMAPPLANSVDVAWNQTLLDVWFAYPIRNEGSRLSIHSELARLGIRVVTVLRFELPGGAIRAFEFTGDAGMVRLDPRWHQA